MARPEITGRGIGPTEVDAFSIAEFCQRHGISIGMYYKMRAQDPKSVPREIHVGTAADQQGSGSRLARRTRMQNSDVPFQGIGICRSDG